MGKFKVADTKENVKGKTRQTVLRAGFKFKI